MIKPDEFYINFDELLFADLRKRIAETRWPSATTIKGWQHGTPVDALRDILAYWSDGYDWHHKEAELNSYPQYISKIGDISLHFFHIPGKHPDSIPILMAHGWPDSFLRYAKTFPLLTDFSLVVPSMPGFAFSTLPEKGYTNNSETADLYHHLMTEILGYKSYVAVGGDMGRGVVCYLASRYPKSVRGLMLTDVGFAKDIATSPDDKLTSEDLDYKHAAIEWLQKEGAYINIQSTKPMSLGYGLSDSPAGMTGWLVEKYHDWSDWERFSIDDLLDNMTLYWMTNCAQSSVRQYYGNSYTLPPMGNVTVPTAIAHFPKDILPVPRAWIERNYPLVQFTEMPYGGHFTAMEAPEPFASALREFIDKLK